MIATADKRIAPNPLTDRAKQLAASLSAIKTMDLAGLRQHWAANFGSPPALRSVDIVRLMLAWRLQARIYGGLDAGMRKKLKRKTTIDASNIALECRTQLTRNWQGKTYEITVVEDGFVWNGAKFASLSAVACAITGTRRNGPPFLRTSQMPVVNAIAGYDDGGHSGGSMNRPALQHLLAEVAAGKIDVIVVYKIDRLTRSLADFARMVELFDKHEVSFVSVTQSFNTTNPMGRLTLNVLLSFAQFEREVTGERIRDKIAASKAKGMWMGGTLPLGYNLPTDKSRTLVRNEAEAQTVELIFRKYLMLGSVRSLKSWLKEEDIVSKLRTARSGRRVGGVPFSRGALYHLLRNETYLGMIRHKDQLHPASHPPLIDRELFEKV